MPRSYILIIFLDLGGGVVGKTLHSRLRLKVNFQ